MKTKKQTEELLGMSSSAAERKLRKAVMHELARQLGKNVCLDCCRQISDPEDLAVVHVNEWGDGPSFFDLANVAFSHASCRTGRQDRRQGEKMKKLIEVTVETAEGQPLRGCKYEGQLYVAGTKDQRYQIRVRNLTGKRLCVVTTVDGRNVNTGEKGSWDGQGFVLDPHDSWIIKGWRQSNDEVAAFRLGIKEDAYSAQLGSAENVGVIGVAVFEEKEYPPSIITIQEAPRTKWYPVPMPYPVPLPNPYVPINPHPRPWWYGSDTGITCTTENNVQLLSAVQASAQGSHASIPQKGISVSSDEHTQMLGTEYGETLVSRIKTTTFRREDSPSELHTIRYDSLEALLEAGIMSEKPSERRAQPQAFPETPGFCAPPVRRRFV